MAGTFPTPLGAANRPETGWAVRRLLPAFLLSFLALHPPTLQAQGQPRLRQEAPSARPHSVHTSGKEAVVRLPLSSDPTGVDLAATVALTFKMRGQKGNEFATFELQLDSKPSTTVSLGNILEALPSGITTEWKQVVLGITPDVSARLPRATSLLVRVLHGEEAVIYLKDLSLIPRLDGSESWQMLAVPLRDYDLASIDDISLLILNAYDGKRTRIAKMLGKTSKEEEPVPETTPVLPGGRVPPFPDGFFRVADFDNGRLDRQQRYFSSFQRAPSAARMDLDPAVKRGRGGKSLRLDYDRREEGFCGFWIHLRETQKPPAEPVYFDATPFHYLSFWVKGLRGGEDATVQLADYEWERKDDSFPLALLSEFLPAGVNQEWQEVVIPLDPSRHRNLDFGRLASLTFSVRYPSSGTIYIDDIAFKTAAQVQVPPTSPPPAQPLRKTFGRATWIWNPTPVLSNQQKRKELFRFARREGVKVFFLQTHCVSRKAGKESPCQLDNEKHLKRFIGQARRQGIEVQALDGDPYYVLPHWRPRVLAQVRAVLDYNARARPSERFAGIHHDNEPYLIPAFSGVLREWLLVQLLELASACQRLIRQAPGRLLYGVDIPFWYDAEEVTWQGVRKPMSSHLIDIVDQVGVMAYRTAAHGANGVIVLAGAEMDYAGRRGKQVFVALETGALPDQTTYTFTSASEVAELRAAAARAGTYLMIEEWDGAAILYWKEFGSPLGIASASLPELPTASRKRRVLLSVEKFVLPASKVSFAELPAEHLEAAVERVLDEFRGEAGFAGVAIHHYESYRTLTRP